jgi:hypothetical protein
MRHHRRTLTGVSFFSEIPQPPAPEPVQQHRPVWMQPDHVIPGSVPGELLLIRTDDVAVAIGCIRAYPNGFEFTAHVRTRGNAENEPGWNDPFDRFGRRSKTPGDVLQLGLLYSDGRRGATTRGFGTRGDLVLTPGGSGGSAQRWDGNFWVHPLPPDGPVTFVASWTERGAAETQAELDGAALRTAVARAVILWPEEPDIYPSGSPATSSITFTSRKADESGPEADRPQH